MSAPHPVHLIPAGLDGLPGGQGLNIAHEAVDRHAAGPLATNVALRWLPRRGVPLELTYHDLAARTSQFANAVLTLTTQPRVATLLGRRLELWVSALGAMKAGGVYSPLFAAFGPEPVRQRLALGAVNVLVTTRQHFDRKVVGELAGLPELRHVLLVGDDAAPSTVEHVHVHRFDAVVDPAATAFEIAPTDPEQHALVHFTSGTTGTPKGAVHVHAAVEAHARTGREVLDLHPGDVYWCTADPGWVTGTSYGIIAPLTNGVTAVIDEADFDADRWYGIVQDQRVAVWYTAPTAIRMLMRVGTGVAREYDLSSLRLVASVGEPLNPEGVVWGEEVFGFPILDNWWQTETGGIMIANTRGQPVKPGSMGRPVTGIDATILRRDDDGTLITDDAGAPVEAITDEVGELALRAGWASMFRGYLGAEERYRSCFVGPWYRSGDLARRDADGHFWFVGRGDDVIKTAGHLVGPFEVESVLIEHPAVAEAGVIGKPDITAGNVIKAFVSLAPGYEDTDELRRELIAFARNRLGAVAAPREIDCVVQLPRTRSGKIMRRLLRARELGLPEGDLSTLEVTA
jgi:acetyl-CoA synthetase